MANLCFRIGGLTFTPEATFTAKEDTDVVVCSLLRGAGRAEGSKGCDAAQGWEDGSGGDPHAGPSAGWTRASEGEGSGGKTGCLPKGGGEGGMMQGKGKGWGWGLAQESKGMVKDTALAPWRAGKMR